MRDSSVISLDFAIVRRARGRDAAGTAPFLDPAVRLGATLVRAPRRRALRRLRELSRSMASNSARSCSAGYMGSTTMNL